MTARANIKITKTALGAPRDLVLYVPGRSGCPSTANKLCAQQDGTAKQWRSAYLRLLVLLSDTTAANLINVVDAFVEELRKLFHDLDGYVPPGVLDRVCPFAHAGGEHHICARGERPMMHQRHTLPRGCLICD